MYIFIITSLNHQKEVHVRNNSCSKQVSNNRVKNTRGIHDMLLLFQARPRHMAIIQTIGFSQIPGLQKQVVMYIARYKSCRDYNQSWYAPNITTLNSLVKQKEKSQHDATHVVRNPTRNHLSLFWECWKQILFNLCLHNPKISINVHFRHSKTDNYNCFYMYLSYNFLYYIKNKNMSRHVQNLNRNIITDSYSNGELQDQGSL